MNKMIANRSMRHSRVDIAENGEFDATDVDARYYEERGMARRKQSESKPDEAPAPRRRGRPPTYQTRQLQAEPVKSETVNPLSTQDLPPESKLE